jgi:transposase
MTTRRQDSGETWGNDPKRRTQGNATEKEKETTRGKMLVSQARQAALTDRQKKKKKEFQRQKKGTPTRVPVRRKRRGLPDYIRLVNLSLVWTLGDGRRIVLGEV